MPTARYISASTVLGVSFGSQNRVPKNRNFNVFCQALRNGIYTSRLTFRVVEPWVGDPLYITLRPARMLVGGCGRKSVTCSVIIKNRMVTDLRPHPPGTASEAFVSPGVVAGVVAGRPLDLIVFHTFAFSSRNRCGRSFGKVWSQFGISL